MIVISCFDKSTVMVKPWAEAGYTCYCVDIQHPPGETKEVTFTLTEKELGYYFPNGDYVVESGQFNVYVGTNSEEVQKATFSIQ